MGEQSPGWRVRQEENFQTAATGVVDELLGDYMPKATEDNPYADLQSGGLVGDIDSAVKGGVRALGADVVPAVSNFVIDSGFTLAKKIIPDDWQDSIVNYSKQAWDALAANPTVAKGIEIAQEGMDEYDAWAKENPQDAKQLEAAVNIGSLTKPKGAPISRSLKKDANLTIRSNRKAAVREMMEPIGKKGDGTLKIEGKGLNRKKVYEPSKFEADVNSEVMRVPEVNPKRAYTENMNAVRDRSAYYRDELEEFIVKRKKNPEISTTKLKTTIANKVNAIDEETLLVGDARAQAIKIYGKAQKLIDESDGTAMGILQARRDLDTWILKSKNGVFDSNMDSAIAVAAREVRGAMNDSVGNAVGSARVKKLLDRQHKLLSGADLLESKALKEADGVVGRMIGRIEEQTGTKFPTTPLAQAATVVGAAALGGGVPAAGAAALIGGYKGLKWLRSGPGMKWMAEMARLVETNPALRPDFNALVQLSQGLRPTEDE